MKGKNRPVFYTINDLSERWGMRRQTIARQIREAQLPAFRIGKQWRISEQTIRDIESGRSGVECEKRAA